MVVCRAVKSEALGSLPSEGNILLPYLVCILFSLDYVESTECISI